MPLSRMIAAYIANIITTACPFTEMTFKSHLFINDGADL